MSQLKSSTFLRWLPFLIWGLIIIVLSVMPGGAGDLNLFGIPYFDKLGHFGMYGVWAFLFFYALSANSFRSLKKSLWVTILIAALTGIALECAQYLMRQGRSFELADMLANAFGAVIGGWIGFFSINYRKNKKL